MKEVSPGAPCAPALARAPEALHERVLLDALATRFDVDRAEEVLAIVLGRAGQPSNVEPGALAAFVRGPVRAWLIDEIGVAEAHEVLVAAAALASSLAIDPLLRLRRPERGPYILLSERPSLFERLIDLRRVTCPLDILSEAQHAPTAVILVDVPAGLLAAETLVVLLGLLPSTSAVVVVGASPEYRRALDASAPGRVTFSDDYEPIGLVGRGPRAAAVSAAAAARQTEPARRAA